tara:strand:+ start:97 stop:726 length:630 start_codon:yes stop_codon:yes gene_type:complete
MKLVKLFFLITLFFIIVPSKANIEEPDILIKRLTDEIIVFSKTDKEMLSGSKSRVIEIINKKILPYVSFKRMTSTASGRYWRDASEDQKLKLILEFKKLLVFTYAGAISKIKNQEVQFKPIRMEPNDTEVEIHLNIMKKRGDSFQISYRLEKTDNGWKIYDVNILGAWLVETYKAGFSSEIRKNGLDGLISLLNKRNKNLSEAFDTQIK